MSEQPNFTGRSEDIGVGQYELSNFRAMAASIRVPAGLVAVLYEAADSGCGYGASVDLLEDHVDLSDVNFSSKAAHINVLAATKGSSIWPEISLRTARSSLVTGSAGAREAAGPRPTTPTTSTLRSSASRGS